MHKGYNYALQVTNRVTGERESLQVVRFPDRKRAQLVSSRGSIMGVIATFHGDWGLAEWNRFFQQGNLNVQKLEAD